MSLNRSAKKTKLESLSLRVKLLEQRFTMLMNGILELQKHVEALENKEKNKGKLIVSPEDL